MNEIDERNPNLEIPQNTEITPATNMEDYKAYQEMVEKLQSMGRRQRRTIIKPHFTNEVKDTFRKQQLAIITAKKESKK